MSVPGWRARIGMISPALGVSGVPEFSGMLPEGVAAYGTRIAMSPGGVNLAGGNDNYVDDRGITHILDAKLKERTKEVLRGRMGQHLLQEYKEAANRLASVCDIILWTAVVPSLSEGPGWDEKMIKVIEEGSKLPGIDKIVPGMTSSTGIKNALKKFNIKKVVLISPYYPAHNELCKEFFEASAGVQILKMKALLLNHDMYDMALYEPGEWYRAVKSVLVPGAEGVIIPCFNVRPTAAIEAMEADMNVTVFAAHICGLWGCLDKLGIKVSIPGHGRLLREGLV